MHLVKGKTNEFGSSFTPLWGLILGGILVLEILYSAITRIIKSIRTKCIQKEKQKNIVLLLEELLPFLKCESFANEKTVSEKTRILYDYLEDFNIPAPNPIYQGEGIAAYDYRRKYWLECTEKWLFFLTENKIKKAKNVWFHVGNQLQ